MELLKLFTVPELTALSGSRFQSLIVRGENEFLYISLSVAMTLICLLCLDLGGLVLKAM